MFDMLGWHDGGWTVISLYAVGFAAVTFGVIAFVNRWRKQH